MNKPQVLFTDQDRVMSKSDIDGAPVFVKSASMKAGGPFKLLEKELQVMQANPDKDYFPKLQGFAREGGDLKLHYNFLDSVSGHKGFLVNGELPDASAGKNASIVSSILDAVHDFHEVTQVTDIVPESVFNSAVEAKLWLGQLMQGKVSYPDHDARILPDARDFLETNSLRELTFKFHHLIDQMDFAVGSRKYLVHGDLQVGYLNPYLANQLWTGNIYVDTDSATATIIDLDWCEFAENYDLAMAYDLGFMLHSCWSAGESGISECLNTQVLLHIRNHKTGNYSEAKLLQFGLLAAFYYRVLPRICEYANKSDSLFKDNSAKRLAWAKRLFSLYGLN